MGYNRTFLLVFSLLWAGGSLCASHEVPMAPKKVVIFSSTGGGGHTAAAAAITEYLSSGAEVTTVNIFKEVFYSGPEAFYNNCLAHNRLGLASALAVMGRFGFQQLSCLVDVAVKKHLHRLLVQGIKPDLVISVVPFINGAIARFTAQHNIPFIIVAPDFDIVNYLPGFSVVPPQFSLLVPHHVASSQALLEKYDIPLENLQVVGLPVRKQFLMAYPRQKVRADYCKKVSSGASPRALTIMLLMGAVGSESVYSYAKALAAMNTSKPMHVIVCVGKNEALAKKISSIVPQGNMHITVQRFTAHIALLMAMSDVLITKPGPTSISEALHMQLPLILDHTKGQLSWEKANSDFVTKHGIGYVIDKLTTLPALVRSCSPAVLRVMKNRMRKLAGNPCQRIQSFLKSQL